MEPDLQRRVKQLEAVVRRLEMRLAQATGEIPPPDPLRNPRLYAMKPK